MITMMAKQIVDRQLESLSKELETEEKLVLEFWGVLRKPQS
ncbi:MAG: hypothetical protein ACRCTK_01425 [Alphaproteobacteria bacterium]